MLRRALFGLLLLALALPAAADGHHAPYLGVQSTWDVPEALRGPHALATGPDGSVYTLQSSDAVTRFDRDGKVLARWGDRPGDPDMSVPQDIAVGASGAVYVTVSGYADPNKVLKFSPDGDLLATWDGTNGTPAFEDPVGITTDPAGYVYVGSGPDDDRAIVKLREDGTVVDRLGAFAFLYLARDGDGFFYGPDEWFVLRLGPTGAFVGPIGFPPAGPEPGHFGEAGGAGGVEVGADNSIWAVDPTQRRLQRFSRDGALLDVCGAPFGDSPFNSPLDVAPSGDAVVVVDGFRVLRIGMVTPPTPSCDTLAPTPKHMAIVLKGGPKTWFRRSSLALSTTEPAHAKLTLQRRSDNRRRWRRLDRGRADLEAGNNRVDFSHVLDVSPKPKAGRYRIKLRLKDEAGNRSRLRKRKFRVE